MQMNTPPHPFLTETVHLLDVFAPLRHAQCPQNISKGLAKVFWHFLTLYRGGRTPTPSSVSLQEQYTVWVFLLSPLRYVP
jgi:hypothetical protein